MSLRITMSREGPTAASKIRGSSVPSALRIEKPAMCEVGSNPELAGARALGEGVRAGYCPRGCRGLRCRRSGAAAHHARPCLAVAGSQVHALELHEQRVARPLRHPVERRRGRADLAVKLAQGDRASRTPARFSPCVPTWITSSSSRSIDGDDGRVRDPVGDQALGLLHGASRPWDRRDGPTGRSARDRREGPAGRSRGGRRR